jgi:hypothetical protein
VEELKVYRGNVMDKIANELLKIAREIISTFRVGQRVQVIRNVVDINGLEKATIKAGTVATIENVVWQNTYSILPDGDKEMIWKIELGRLPIVHSNDIRLVD